MKTRLMRITLFIAAAIIGGAAAWWLMPHWNDMRALARIASDNHASRDRGWHWLTSARPDDPTVRAARVIDRVNDALTDAGDEALMHAGDVLRPLDLWNWQTQPPDLALRERALRAVSHEGDQQLAAVELRDCPLGAPADTVIAAIQPLLDSTDPDVRMLALRASLAWAGINRLTQLRSLELPRDDHALRRLHRLAMSWARVPTEAPLELTESVEVLEAVLMQAVRADPDDAADVIAVKKAWNREQVPAFAYIFRHSDDPDAERELRRMADRGEDAARFALHARHPQHDAQRAESIARDAQQPPWRRRLAAWRLAEIDDELLRELLVDPIADADESVYTVALLAERHVESETQGDLAEQWMRDLNDDRKRAGALLAALIGEHVELLDELAELPDNARLRTTARLASASMTNDARRDKLNELGFRALHKPDGDFNADMLLAMLAAGYTDMLELLVDPPRGDWRMAIQQRAMLIERFIPHWHETAGRPISGDARTILLHFDWLRTRWLLDSRRLSFTTAERVYQPVNHR